MPTKRQEENLMVNLSSWVLDDNELHLLQLELSFVPTPNYYPFQTWIDLFKLFCNIKLKKMFGEM